MSKEIILFIEDDKAGREMGAFNLEKAGFEVETAASGEAGLEAFDPKRHGLVITDVRMPGISGMEVLKRVKERAPDVPVLVITAYAEVSLAVEAMKRGAFDFIGKPFNRDHLLITVEKALGRRRLEREVRDLRVKVTGVERPIVFASDAMARVLSVTDRVAASDASVLITGESGVGKELIARRIHVTSPKASGPFVAVNGAAIPAELLESELFGYEKGAFTGAGERRLGRFRQAEGGTLFLDEIGELPVGLQTKLLRVLEEKSVQSLGADKATPLNVRIVAATNIDIEAAVKSGAFREDLYYRLNVVEIDIPPLRERSEDVPVLARHFVDGLAEGLVIAIPSGVMDRLAAHDWPGNIRELENTCRRLVLLCQGDTLSAHDLPVRLLDGGRGDTGGADGIADHWPELPEEGFSLVDLERRVIERVLVLKQGNVTQSAAFLKVPRHVLSYRMEKYGIERKPS